MAKGHVILKLTRFLFDQFGSQNEPAGIGDKPCNNNTLQSLLPTYVLLILITFYLL